jgi:site-specific recombinase XerD
MEPTPPRKLLDQVRDALRVKHYAYSTEESYVQWIRRYILFHKKRHPKDMAEPEVQAFLTHLAVEGNVAASTQNQALSALLFLYRHVLKQPFSESIDAVRKAIQASVHSPHPRRSSTGTQTTRKYPSTTSQASLQSRSRSQRKGADLTLKQ